MKLRSLLAAAAAALVFAAAVAPSVADAATRRRHARHSAVHSQRMARNMPMRYRGGGGDSGNAAVDRLNAQSLQNARSGTGAAGMGGGGNMQ